MNFRFLKCENCGAMVGVIKNCECDSCGISCCGKPMIEMPINNKDASSEKHLPNYEIKDNIVYVTIGNGLHPMDEKHYIEWVSIQTRLGNQRKQLKPGNLPKVEFSILDGDSIEAVYAYCNLHGLWKA